jgi:hypothetical protein
LSASWSTPIATPVSASAVPVKQLPERRVVTAGHVRDQLVVVHHLTYCTSPGRGSR